MRVILLNLLFISTVVLANENIDDLLESTEDLRSSDFQLFSDNLLNLQQKKEDFTKLQSCRFQFLNYYKLSYSGQYENAVNGLVRLFDECDTLSIRIRIKSLLANLYGISGQYKKSISQIDFVVSSLDKIVDIKTEYIAYTTILIVYGIVDQWELSLKYAELLLHKNPPLSYKCKAMAHKLFAKYKLDIKDELLNNEESTLKSCLDSGENLYAYTVSFSIVEKNLFKFADNEYFKKNIDQVMQLSNDIEKTGYTNLIAVKNNLLAQIYKNNRQLSLAVRYAELSIRDSISIGDTDQKIEALNLLVDYYQSVSDYKTANIYLLQKIKSEKMYYSDKQSKIMAYQTVKHNNLAKTQQIKYLNNQNRLLSLEKALTEKKSTNQKLVILFLFSLMGFMVLWGFRSRKIQKMYKHLSETDNMTDIYNRKGFRDFAEDLLLQSKKEGKTVALAIFDLDNFKRINDKYGHLKGDWVIKSTITQCQLVQNDKITIGRIGGEEFAIIMRDSTSDELSGFAEECRKMIENIDSGSTGYDFVITASFGVTSTNASGYVYSKLLSDADHAMYDAKTSGRNMVINYKYNPI